MSLFWKLSTDPDSTVVGYRVYRNGSQVAQTSNTTNFTDTGLSDGTSYSYHIVAYDAANNVSGASNTASATPAATLSSTSSWDPSGQAMPVGNTSGWHQVFADNFANDSASVGSASGCSWPDGANIMSINCTGLAPWPTIAAKWFAYPDGWSDGRYNTYYPSRVLGIGKGVMDYYLHTETINGMPRHMTSALVPKIPGGTGSAGGQLYGRYTVRARFDSLPGYHVAFLLWPDSNNWPVDGEIDFPDDRLDESTHVDAFVHYGTSTSPQFDHFRTAANLTQWHTYEIDWLSTGLNFYLDGKLVGAELTHIPKTPMHWVLQTDTWGGELAPSDATAGHVQVAWASAYTSGETGSCREGGET